MELLPARRYDWTKKQSVWRWQPAKPRTILGGAILHESVLQRMDALPEYRPANLPTHVITELRQRFPIES
jgi:hypothetical protein